MLSLRLMNLRYLVSHYAQQLAHPNPDQISDQIYSDPLLNLYYNIKNILREYATSPYNTETAWLKNDVKIRLGQGIPEFYFNAKIMEIYYTLQFYKENSSHTNDKEIIYIIKSVCQKNWHSRKMDEYLSCLMNAAKRSQEQYNKIAKEIWNPAHDYTNRLAKKRVETSLKIYDVCFYYTVLKPLFT